MSIVRCLYIYRLPSVLVVLHIGQSGLDEVNGRIVQFVHLAKIGVVEIIHGICQGKIMNFLTYAALPLSKRIVRKMSHLCYTLLFSSYL